MNKIIKFFGLVSYQEHQEILTEKERQIESLCAQINRKVNDHMQVFGEKQRLQQQNELYLKRNAEVEQKLYEAELRLEELIGRNKNLERETDAHRANTRKLLNEITQLQEKINIVSQKAEESERHITNYKNLTEQTLKEKGACLDVIRQLKDLSRELEHKATYITDELIQQVGLLILTAHKYPYHLYNASLIDKISQCIYYHNHKLMSEYQHQLINYARNTEQDSGQIPQQPSILLTVKDVYCHIFEQKKAIKGIGRQYKKAIQKAYDVMYPEQK